MTTESGTSSVSDWLHGVLERRAGGPGGSSAEQLFFIALGSVLGATALILCLLGVLCCVLQRNALRRRRQRTRAAVGLHYASHEMRALSGGADCDAASDGASTAQHCTILHCTVLCTLYALFCLIRVELS